MRLPRGTLGHAFACHIRTNGFDPDYYRKIDVRTDIDYVMMRIRRGHFSIFRDAERAHRPEARVPRPGVPACQRHVDTRNSPATACCIAAIESAWNRSWTRRVIGAPSRTIPAGREAAVTR